MKTFNIYWKGATKVQQSLEQTGPHRENIHNIVMTLNEGEDQHSELGNTVGYFSSKETHQKNFAKG